MHISIRICLELPPTKRRRTLAGSIVSTALSAALIGTAVGLTVYRLWRDRGKEPEQLSPSSPPPPYREGEWRPAEPIQSERPYRQNIHVAPPTPQKRRTQARHTASIRKPVQRRTRARPNVVVASRDESPFEHLDPKPTYQQPAVSPEFDFGKPPEEEVEDQMDWIGDKLSMLIEEGKRALGREVVVMSDAREDEVDDGAGGWEEVEPTSHRSSHSISASRHSSMRRSAKRPRAIATSIFPPAAAHAYSSPASPSRSYRNQSPGSHAGFSHSSDGALTPRRGSTVDREFRVGSVREDEENWESPELKEQMERARARIKRNRI